MRCRPVSTGPFPTSAARPMRVKYPPMKRNICAALRSFCRAPNPKVPVYSHRCKANVGANQSAKPGSNRTFVTTKAVTAAMVPPNMRVRCLLTRTTPTYRLALKKNRSVAAKTPPMPLENEQHHTHRMATAEHNNAPNTHDHRGNRHRAGGDPIHKSRHPAAVPHAQPPSEHQIAAKNAHQKEKKVGPNDGHRQSRNDNR